MNYIDKKGKLLVSVQNMWKIYGNTPVVKNFSLNIYEGQGIAMMGANGAGKTTVVESICGLNDITKGKISYHFSTKNFREKIGIQFQDNFYPQGISVVQLVDFYKDVYKNYNLELDMDYLIDQFDIRKLFKYNISKLSGGELQRLNILLAIINNPKLVFFDEISTGLDIQAKIRIISLIKELKQKHKWTTFIITHNIDDIVELCDRVVVMSRGRKVYDSTVTEILKKYKSLENFILREVKSTLLEIQKPKSKDERKWYKRLFLSRKETKNVTIN